MRRRHFLLALTAFVLLGLSLPTQAEEPPRPNILLVLVDDMGWKDPGFTGNTLAPTPHLDALAEAGTVFTQAYAAAPNCAPTRACLMTGQYTPRHGVYTVVDDRYVPGLPYQEVMPTPSRAALPTEATTIAEVLRKGEYATGMVGMWNLGRGQRGPTTPSGQGFDVAVQPKALGFAPGTTSYVSEQGHYLTDRLTDAGVKFIQSNKHRPFFLYMAYHAVHSPWQPKKDWLEKFAVKTSDPEQVAYAATLAILDDNIGRLVAELRRLEVLDRTYIVVTSDNGGLRRFCAPLRGGKGTLFEGGIRVPACVTGPGILAGRRVGAPISTIDLFPTLCAMAGVPPPGDVPLDGVDLLPVLEDRDAVLPERALFWHFPSYIGRGGPCSALRTGQHKIIEDFVSGSVACYDLEVDPGEEKDLSRRDPALAKRLLGQLREMQTALDAPLPTEANPNYDPDAEPPRGRGRRERGRGDARGRGRRENQK